MSRGVPWLPDACLRNERAATQLVEAVEGWSRRWIARGRWRAIGTLDEASDDPDTGGWSALRTGGRSTLEGMPRSVLRLALAMLGEDERATFSSRDHKFLRRLAGEALDDLAALADQVVPGSDRSEGAWVGTPWTLPIGPIAEPLLRISLARADLCVLARQSFPRNPVGSLEPRGTAVSETLVPISIHLGTAKMDVTQFDALEPGDVIVLDRSVTDPAMLLVADRPTPLPCTLSQQDAALVLHVAEPA